MTLLYIMALMLLKHFICDFLTQTPYQIKNKINYGHIGGIIHAIIHGLGTFIVFIFFYSLEIACSCALLDILIHYHIDWAKAKVGKALKLRMDGPSAKAFWAIFGFDQFLHQMTYVGLIILATRL